MTGYTTTNERRKMINCLRRLGSRHGIFNDEASLTRLELVQETANFFFSGYLKRKKLAAILHVHRSGIPNANLGTFAVKDIVKGCPVCFYPGEYLPPLPLSTIDFGGDLAAVFDPERNLLHSGYPRRYLMHVDAFGGEIDAQAFRLDADPWSCGHMINHCPKGKLPNVNPFSFRWKEIVDQTSPTSQQIELPNFVSSRPWYATSDGEIVYADQNLDQLPGVLFFATHDINSGEELIWDYQVKNGSKIYDWYFDVEYQ